MKKLLLPALLTSAVSFGQTNTDLKNDVKQIKTDLATMKQQIQAVTTQNTYLKKALDVNTPVLEQTQNDSLYRITSVVGSKKDKTVTVTFLAESKDQNKTASFSNSTLIDLEGNTFDFDYNQSFNPSPKLTLNVPLKIKFVFKNFVDEPEVIKLFKFNTSNTPEDFSSIGTRSIQEFRDLNVNWQ